ncbi:kinase-like protein [Aureobasidium namibiae CBS 147.97]|uniref:Kinase-like protein n=1 Tax=Aureobasidium namibiae CBS 147.97 TaxID=1043004 RepID=A0A074WRC5_9PEZI|nr:kinase-like protein [Aureobasidium namibiae CBS 147.97]KEQ72257.1 kinase-like protein [Aureobasidium namibiae CBS 147.97]
MFSSALKSFSSNIGSNYTIAPQPSSTSGPWKIFDAKKKSTGKPASVFVFDKKSLEPSASSLGGGRGNSSSIKRAQEEVIERLKKEASSLARLRHPSVLELAEPVEETRSGGLMFATEQVTVSLAALLAEKDDQERSGRNAGRGSRYVVRGSDGHDEIRELELDELEIQKGLLQIAKGLDFLHQSAKLVHANLTPDAIFVNAKSDWKISGLAFSTPFSDSVSSPSLSLSEVLNHDPRLPPSVQLSLDYTSPDFVLDNNINPSADMFSLGLLIIALYNSPHRSPIETHESLSAYKRTFSSSSSVPNQSNNFLSSVPLPKNLSSELLPRLITRRPAQRLNAMEFQQAQYFDNILVSTIRFLDDLPAKTPSEKAQFMRGLAKIMPQFPKSVLERKLLPALLEEMKDRELLAPILLNVFAIVKASPSGKRVFTDKVIPRLRDIFLTQSNAKTPAERDTTKEAGLMIVLENTKVVTDNCSGKEFRDDILPIIALGLASPTHAVVDAALSTLPAVLPALDYSTIKNELFPVIAGVFAHTNSLGIKIRGLEAFYTLCGGTAESDSISDGLDGVSISHDSSKLSSSQVLDKFTIQEKVVPLMKGIKTKEPGVMMAALKVFRQIGQVVDADFLAMEALPILWSFSLGPLLDLEQFQAFMTLIKSLSSRIEREHTRKLQELGSTNGAGSTRSGAKQPTAFQSSSATNSDEVDFASLVSGRKGNATPDIMNDWGPPAAKPASTATAMPGASQASSFSSWTSAAPTPASRLNSLQPATRTVTPDLNGSFAALTPASPFNAPLQPSARQTSNPSFTSPPLNQGSSNTSSTINWSAATTTPNTSTCFMAQTPANPNTYSAFSMPAMQPQQHQQQQQQRQALQQQTQQQKTNTQSSGLDKYQSLI